MSAHRTQALRAAAVLVVLLVAASTSGCGLTTNDKPETIKDSVPPDLLDTESAAPGSEDGDADPTEVYETVRVYFLNLDDLDEAHVYAQTRQVPRPATQVKVLETLITDPPTELERLNGVSTDVPEDARLNDTPRLDSDGVLTVDLSDDFYELQGETARNAFAQVVFTATELTGVEAVQFLRDGEVFNAVDGDGQSRRDPLGRAAYFNLRPIRDETDDADDTEEPGAEPTTDTSAAIAPVEDA